MEHQAECMTCSRGPQSSINPWCRSCLLRDRLSASECNYLQGPVDEHEVYIAGPFFNRDQVDIIEEIEYVLENDSVSYYSPRLEGGVITDNPELDPKKIFRNNFLAMLRAKWFVTVGVYAGVELFVNKGPDTENPEVNFHERIAIPDTGTVWEAGGGYALGKPIVGYVPALDAFQLYELNLMLTEGWDHICQGPDELRQFINGDPRRTRWQGRVV